MILDPPVLIRPAAEADWPQIWPFLWLIVAAGETYTVDRDIDEETARAWWMRPDARVFVAVAQGRVVGSAKLTRNFDGPASSVANASFLVDPGFAGRGVGRALGEHVLVAAKEAGFRAMQFNAVVETNVTAVTLWLGLGFQILATIPDAFDHPKHGPVGLHVMYRKL
ncbi:GNAT family N-acetyltransferase [Sporichthya brevicatena]|uniref:GNAT family N-acetyltransferase n=1 Tax=Sporichthya brevicatena TaxID=171442 RepID=A0ABN1GJY0_9ACTN